MVGQNFDELILVFRPQQMSDRSLWQLLECSICRRKYCIGAWTFQRTDEVCGLDCCNKCIERASSNGSIDDISRLRDRNGHPEGNSTNCECFHGIHITSPSDGFDTSSISFDYGDGARLDHRIAWINMVCAFAGTTAKQMKGACGAMIPQRS